MTNEDRHLELIRELMAVERPALLFGGYAEDALLYGAVSRPHDDIDVCVWRDEVEVRITEIKMLGLSTMDVRFEPIPDRPLVMVATDGEVEIELVIADRTDGRASFDLPGDDGINRVWMPADFDSTPWQHLDTLSVRTISPLALYQVREASAGVFGGFREKDFAAQSALKSRFFADVEDDELRPKVTRVD